jgi:small-conductance mechanosensitive channel
MDSVLTPLKSFFSLNPEYLHKLIASLLVLVLLWLLRQIVLYLVSRRSGDVRVRYGWRKASSYFTVLIGILILGRIWFAEFESVSVFFGLMSAGLAIALKDPIVNFVGWSFILWRRPFTVGDRVQIGDHAGDVIDLRLFQFTLMEIGKWVDADQSTGRLVHVPNGKIFTEELLNYSKGFQYIWNELPVLVTFESNWRSAKAVLMAIGSRHAEHLSKEAEEGVKEAARKFMIIYTVLTPTVYIKVKDSGVCLTLRYLCKPHKRRDSEHAIWEDVLAEFSGHDDIEFAYPTVRRYDNQREGKAGVQPRLRNDQGKG